MAGFDALLSLGIAVAYVFAGPVLELLGPQGGLRRGRCLGGDRRGAAAARAASASYPAPAERGVEGIVVRRRHRLNAPVRPRFGSRALEPFDHRSRRAAVLALNDGSGVAWTPSPPPTTYDAIVIGGGHNGLVAAAYLAKAGARTVVLEARHKTGGAADTMAPWPEAPEFKVTTLSYVMSLMPDTILRDLQLERHGYRVHPTGPYFLPFPDGRCIVQYDDDARRTTTSSRSSPSTTPTRSSVGRVDRRARRGARPAADDHAADASGRCGPPT